MKRWTRKRQPRPNLLQCPCHLTAQMDDDAETHISILRPFQPHRMHRQAGTSLNSHLRRPHANRSGRILWRDLLVEASAFFMLAASIVLLWRESLFLLSIVACECIVLLFVWHGTHDVLFLVITVGLGSLAEIVFVHFGVWSYGNPAFLGIPLWFPLAFGTAALVTERTVCTVQAMVRPDSAD